MTGALTPHRDPVDESGDNNGWLPELEQCTPLQTSYLMEVVRRGNRQAASKASGIALSTVRGWRYHSNPYAKAEDAIERLGHKVGRELARARFGREAGRAADVVSDILDDDQVPARERLRAASIVLDREYPTPQRGAVIVPIQINVGFSRNDADADTVDGVVIKQQ